MKRQHLTDREIVEWLKCLGVLVWDKSNFGNEYDIEQEFSEPAGSITNVIAALHGSQSYSGAAFILFLKDGKLYEVHGSHCSCYGFERQWCPEPTSLAALWIRDYDDSFDPKLVAALDALYTALSPFVDQPHTEE